MSIQQRFQERTTAELNFSLSEVEWWNDRVRRGLARTEDAQGYIDIENRIVKIKRDVLGLS